MRHGGVVVCLVAAVIGCKSENELRYTATLQSVTNGVALSDDGLDGVAAMSGTTCTIDTSWGCPTADEDLPTDEERVLDHFGGRTLGLSAEGLHTIRDGVWVPETDEHLAGVVHAALLPDDGRLVLSSHHDACWIQRDDEVAREVPAEACGATRFAVDRERGALFAAAPGGIVRIDRDGEQVIPMAADLVAYDATLDRIYTASSGDDQLSAITREGDLLWLVTTGGPIRSLATRGDHGEVLVLVERSDGFGLMERRDGEDGKLLGSSLLPNANGDVTVSGNGLTVAVVREEEVNFFSLTTKGEEPAVDETPPDCIDPDRRTQD